MKRLSPSMLVALAALAVALGGTAFAAGPSLVGSRQIADHSIQLVDLQPALVQALRGQRGPQGPPGPSGDFDLGKVRSLYGQEVRIDPEHFGVATAECPEGAKSIAGGYSLAYPTFDASPPLVVNSGQNSESNWAVTVVNGSHQDEVVATPLVVCILP
jgi:hypothetical protein